MDSLAVHICAMFVASSVACASHPPKLSYAPPEYAGVEFERPPNGESEAKRYASAYAAFWWNCVAVKAESLDSGCPFVCSGTPGATAGCRDGATDAEEGVAELVGRLDATELQAYLRKLAVSPDARESMRPYFGNSHRAANPPEYLWQD